MKRYFTMICMSLLVIGAVAQKTAGSDVNDLKITVRNTSFVMKFVPHGKSSVVDKNSNRTVVALKDYYVSETEVTNTLWDAVMGTKLSIVQNYPNRVTWVQAYDFVTRLTNITGYQFRLVSENEWEYAASYGNDPSWWFSGSGELNDVWRYPDNPVKSSKEGALNRPNKLGIYGMTNEEGEWCSDTISYDRYTRVIRGKGVRYNKELCKISSRTFAMPSFETACIRLALDYKGVKKVTPQPQNFSKNPVALPSGMTGVFKGTTTSMLSVTIDITKERRRLEAVNNKIGYGFMSVGNYYGNNMKYHIITKVTPAGKNAVNVTLESQEDGTKTTWKLSYSTYGKYISVSVNDYTYDKLVLRKW